MIPREFKNNKCMIEKDSGTIGPLIIIIIVTKFLSYAKSHRKANLRFS